MALETISGGAKIFATVGDRVEGFLVNVTPPTGEGNNVLHFINPKDSEPFDAFSATALNNILLVDGESDEPAIKKEYKGLFVVIELTGFGEAPKKGYHKPKQFRVQVDRNKKLLGK